MLSERYRWSSKSASRTSGPSGTALSSPWGSTTPLPPAGDSTFGLVRQRQNTNESRPALVQMDHWSRKGPPGGSGGKENPVKKNVQRVLVLLAALGLSSTLLATVDIQKAF